MQLTIITVGKLKEPGFRALRDEYVKRLGRFCRLEEVELPDLPEPAAPSEALEKQVMQREGEAILQRIRPGDYVVAMTIPGKQWDSPALSRHLSDLKCRGVGRMVFVIGGSLGLSDAVKQRADEELSMSKMARWDCVIAAFFRWISSIVLLVMTPFTVIYGTPMKAVLKYMPCSNSRAMGPAVDFVVLLTRPPIAITSMFGNLLNSKAADIEVVVTRS